MKARVRSRASTYITVTDQQQLMQLMLQDINAVVEEHLSGIFMQEGRGAGIGSMVANFMRWLMPKASRLLSIIPQEVKDAAAQQATSVAVSGINRAGEYLQSRINPTPEPRGAGVYAVKCMGNACMQECASMQRGGFLGSLLGGIASVALPLLTSAFTSRGSGLGSHWESIYPTPTARASTSTSTLGKRGGGGRKVAIDDSPPEKQSKSVLEVHKDRTKGHMTECVITVQAGPKGGRPMQRKGYINKTRLNILQSQ
uniref:LO6 n=1 Tax=Swordtail adomavirus 2 TaxID=2609877 RepID=A0A6F9FAE4_9VIRU|nr:TPA_asm: LO6 [Swordtail adomavirus 2]